MKHVNSRIVYTIDDVTADGVYGYDLTIETLISIDKYHFSEMVAVLAQIAESRVDGIQQIVQEALTKIDLSKVDEEIKRRAAQAPPLPEGGFYQSPSPEN